MSVEIAVGIAGGDAVDLLREDARGLVPADALIAGNAAGLGMTVAVRIPVDALHRVEDAVLGIQAVLLSHDVLRDTHGLRGGILLAVLVLNGPGLGIVLLRDLQGTDAGDLAVFNVNGDRAAGGQIGKYLFQNLFSPPVVEL